MRIAILGLLAVAAGCSSGSDFAYSAVTDGDQVPTDATLNGSSSLSLDAGTANIVRGYDENGAIALAWYTPGSVGPALTTDAIYATNFSVMGVDDVQPDGSGGFTGNLVSNFGFIQLTADFSEGTVSGTAFGTDFSVAGTFTGSTLGGEVAYRGQAMPLEGSLGADHLVGAFHYNDDDTALAGTLITQNPPP